MPSPSDARNEERDDTAERQAAPDVGNVQAQHHERDRDRGDRPGQRPEADDLAAHDLHAETGEIRNSSIIPVVRSRMTDRAMSDTAMCWRMSASTAGPKYSTTVGWTGAMLLTSARVGDAMISGGIWPAWGSELCLPLPRRRAASAPGSHGADRSAMSVA